MDTPTLNVLSLCTGGGGLDLGVKLAIPAARTVCCVEHEAFCCELLAARMEAKALDDAPIWTDLRTFDGRPWRGVVDYIIAGIPCPPVSVARRHAVDYAAEWLWPETWRVFREVQPPQGMLLENVAGILSANNGGVFANVLGDLAETRAFDLAWATVPTYAVGLPHSRQRVFLWIVAHADRPRLQGSGYAPRPSARERPAPNMLGVGPPGPSAVASIPRMADGMARKMDCWADRMRVTGRGVVPLQAAYAFLSLYAHLAPE